MLLNSLAEGAGGFLGAVARYLLGLIPVKNPAGFPVTTFLVNLLGAFTIGGIVSWATKNQNLDPKLILFLKTGICGGFTTFSTLSLEATQLFQSGKTAVALIYVCSSAVLGVLAVLAGLWVAR